jgi:2-polyprenyl-3-methyl-5-hydroxy-6-metoxy-1,4-benzoquinol methylase
MSNDDSPRSSPEVTPYDLPVKHFLYNPGASQWWIAQWVRPGARVLDIGCASGSVARYLSEEKGCTVIGVEHDPILAEKARAFCQEVHVGDVESAEVRERLVGPFDAVIVADILEHLRRPEHLLESARGLLSDQGRLLVSLPNVANWRIRLRLLFGCFDYTETGILDRTHLRFYTRRTAERLLVDSGYNITRRAHTVGGGRALARAMARLSPGLLAYQFVFEAVPRGSDPTSRNQES